MRGISLAIAVALLAMSAHADYRKEQARLNREAKLLFATVEDAPCLNDVLPAARDAW